MKRFLPVCLCLLILVMTGCDNRSAVQKATGASAEQGRAIENVLEQSNIAMEMIVTSENPEEVYIKAKGHGLPGEESAYSIYTVTDRDGAEFDLVIQSADTKAVMVMQKDDATLLYSDM